MERKIGNIFPYKGEWYQCVEGTGCYKCDFNFNEDTCTAEDPHCTCRTDHKNVVYKKLEKVGEPYDFDGKKFQGYKMPATDRWGFNTPDTFIRPFGEYIDIEIKNQEDMEEKKLNLKEFDLEAAKAGKPVCTRDGRKARVICFDRLCCDGISNIVACVDSKYKRDEDVIIYNNEGFMVDSKNQRDEDLMMLPEKHEGWVNVYKASKGGRSIGCLHTKREEAVSKVDKGNDDYVATVKIEWEE